MDHQEFEFMEEKEIPTTIHAGLQYMLTYCVYFTICLLSRRRVKEAPFIRMLYADYRIYKTSRVNCDKIHSIRKLYWKNFRLELHHQSTEKLFELKNKYDWFLNDQAITNIVNYPPCCHWEYIDF